MLKDSVGRTMILWVLSSSLLCSQLATLAAAETIIVPWRVPSSGESLENVEAVVGDTLQFQWSGSHTVNIHPSKSCDDTNSVFIGSTSPTRYTLTKEDVGTLYFACQVGNHCEFGQSITVEVTDEEKPDDKVPEFCEVRSSNGVVVQLDPGDVTGSDPVCGEDFDCFCSPGSPNNEYCPYCIFEQVDGSVLCLGDDQTETFVDITGVEQTCSCSIPADNLSAPVQVCSTEQPPLPGNEDDYCVVTDPSTGETTFYENGEAFDFWVDVPCGHGLEFPCRCNTDLPSKVECPYCVIPQEYDVHICALKNERVTFEDIETGEYQSCLCLIDDPLRGGSLVDCEEEVRPTPAPSPSNAGPTLVPPTADEPGGCITVLDDFNEVFTEEGDSFGDLVGGVCGDHFDFPAFCNTAFSNGIEYPYCQFSAREGVVCASDGQTLTYTTFVGDSLSCDCKYTQENGAQATCRGAPTPTSPTFPSPPIRPPSSPTFAPAPVRPSGGSSDTARISSTTICFLSIAIMVRLWNQL